MQRRLSVLTLNLWNLSGPVAQRCAETRRWLELLTPDIACFQEVVYRDGDAATHAAIWDGLGYETYMWGPIEYGDAGTLGNAVISRFPIEEADHTSLPGLDREEGRFALRTRLGTPQGPVDVYCTHLNWRLDEGYVREAQVLALDEWARETASPQGVGKQPPIVAGDFNAEPESTEIRFMSGFASIDGRSTMYQDAFRDTRWRVAVDMDNRNPFASGTHEPDRRIDYVFSGLSDPVTGKGRILHSRVVCDMVLNGTHASDHFGVYAEILT